MNIARGNILLYKLCFLCLAALCCTYLRISLLIIYPLLVVGLYYIFNWKLSRNALYIFLCMGACLLLSLRHGLFIRYNLISLYYSVPFVLLLFATPSRDGADPDYLKFFMNALTIVIIVNNIPGIIQYIIQPGDDRFVGLYGKFTVSQNGLSLMNGLLFFYHLCLFQSRRKTINLLLAGFFILCCVMGFYGAGQLVLIATLMLTYLRLRPKDIVQLVAISLITLGAVVLLMKAISPNTLDYNVNIIKKFASPNIHDVPRKLTVFKNYAKAYGTHPIDLLLGSGPGTFNSRTAFMVGSPYYFNIPYIKSGAKPFYFWNYAYPLWNNTNTGPYDGFMNQPFTTILALLGEYGLIFCVLLFTALAARFRKLNKAANRVARSTGISVETKMYRFCSIFTLLLIIIDNYMEYPEIIVVLLVTVKLSELRITKALNV